MSRFLRKLTGPVLGCALVAWGGMAVAADAPAANTGKILVAKSYRASKLDGLNVRNDQGEKVGKIEDLVIDVASGKVLYAAMSFGGWLGVGDKLFAIPYEDLKFDDGKDETFFVLNVSKDKLKAAPGFDKSDWPNMADPHWAEQIDTYYRNARTTTTGATTINRINNK